MQRWHDDRWVHVDDVDDLFSSSWTAAWQGALFYLRERQPRTLEVVNPAPPIASRVVEDSHCASMPSIATSRDTLVIVGAACGGASTDVTRWTASGPMVDKPVEWPATVSAIATARGPAIIGGRSIDGMTDPMYLPVGVRLDGDRWRSFDPPGQSVYSYAIAPDGTEWAIVEEQGPAVVAREPGGAWQRVDRWRAEVQPYGAAMSVSPDKVWIAEGSVWLAVQLDGGCGMNTPPCELRDLLLRTGPRVDPVMFDRVTP